MQSTFMGLWSFTLSSVADFLMTEPVSYITALIILSFIVGIFKRICNI